MTVCSVCGKIAGQSDQGVDMNMTMTRRSAIGAVIGMMILLAPIAALAASLSGKYTVNGRNPNGSAYSGTVQIIDNNGAVAMSWQVGNTYSGVGKVEGRVLTVDWGANAPVIYVINADGTLYGTWAKGKALELLTPK
jgi:hypothetical protein